MTAKFSLAFLIPCAFAQTHFHHVHLNSSNPATAIEFFTQHLSGERNQVRRCGCRTHSEFLDIVQLR